MESVLSCSSFLIHEQIACNYWQVHHELVASDLVKGLLERLMGHDADIPTSRGGVDNPELREIRALESKLQATEQELESIKKLMTSQQRDDQVRQTKISDFCRISLNWNGMWNGPGHAHICIFYMYVALPFQPWGKIGLQLPLSGLWGKLACIFYLSFCLLNT